ncbi:MAG: hypothetical protein H8E44_03175 [Planctomycetes bacterium]|nr:hypothetical protein [Planctomycetota bacterium]MBL7039454.1 hypothetical protein [Pirellulaceae bacterium]
MPVRTVVSVGKLLQLNLLLVAGLFLSTTQATAQDVDDNGPTGVYTLVTVNGSKLPAKVSHGDVAIQVRSGTFTINADGTCSSRVVFGSPSGADVTRKVNATYTREGAKLNMQWEGAGKTAGAFEGDSFTMNNEGMVFAYKKQPATPTLQEATTTEQSPELKILDISGTWRQTYNFFKAEWTPKQTQLTGTASCTRILKGQFFETKLKGPEGTLDHLILTTYDAHRKSYRRWDFNAESASESIGKWDADAKSMTWSHTRDDGLTSTTTDRHLDADTLEWSLVIKDPNGKAYLHMEGKSTRVK